MKQCSQPYLYEAKRWCAWRVFERPDFYLVQQYASSLTTLGPPCETSGHLIHWLIHCLLATAVGIKSQTIPHHTLLTYSYIKQIWVKIADFLLIHFAELELPLWRLLSGSKVLK